MVGLLLLLAVALQAVASITIPASALGRGHEGVIYSEKVTSPRGKDVRVYFSEAELPRGALLRVTSLSDGYQQHLDRPSLLLWQNSTGYFNGDSVLLEVLFPAVHPLKASSPAAHKHLENLAEKFFPASFSLEPQDVRLILDRVVSSEKREEGEGEEEREGEMGQMSICYSPDTRDFVNDTKQGRYRYDDVDGCCTAWMIDDQNHCFLSAGHCSESGKGMVEFNVPLSAEDGTLIHPPLEDQFVIDQVSMQTRYVGTIDWRYFGVFPNTETGLHPIKAYSGEYYRLLRGSQPAAGTKMRITGFGENESFPKTHRRVLKTATGPFSSFSADAIRYRVDTSNGNSGSAVLDEESGFAVGIHTLGGCRVGTSTSTNAGVNIFTPTLQSALAKPTGICGNFL